MATAAERAVIEAARSWQQARQDKIMPRATELLDALDALDAAEASGEPQEQPVTYGQVVAGDQLQNRNTKAWHKVIENNVRAGKAHVRLRHVAKVIEKPQGEAVTVLRSEMGKAVDMFNIDWSGPNGGPE
jgi:hypothetical protein